MYMYNFLSELKMHRLYTLHVDTTITAILMLVVFSQVFNGTLGSDNAKQVYDVGTMANVTVSCLFNRFFTSK